MGRHAHPNGVRRRYGEEPTVTIPPARRPKPLPAAEPPTVELPALRRPPVPSAPTTDPLRRAAPWAAAAAIAGTVLVAGAVAPHYTEQSHDTVTVADVVGDLPDKGVVSQSLAAQRLSMIAASRQRADADRSEAAAVQAAAETAAQEAQEASASASASSASASASQAAQEAQEAEEAATETTVAESSVLDDGIPVGTIVPGARLTSPYGARWGTFHYGIDLAAPLGTPIYTPLGGTVLKAGPASGFGNAVYIETADGDVMVFGHMREMNVSAGDTVAAGDLIAWVGNEGQSTGPHCHFEVHLGGINGSPTDPIPWLLTHGVSL